MRRRPLGLCLALWLSACSSPAPDPTPPAPPPGPVAFVNMAGTWSGTVESSNLPARAVTMTIVQDAACVDGVWKATEPAAAGAISGYAAADSFSGQVSFEFTTDAGDRCSGVGTASGPVTDGSIRLIASTLASTVVKCNPLLPRDMVLTLQRN